MHLGQGRGWPRRVVEICSTGTFAAIARKNARAWQEIADKFEVNES
jgi:hypothetical protein